MRKALLLYNPDSGGNQLHRRRQLDSALAVLRQAGVEAELAFTESRDQAGECASQAVKAGCDTVFACGGDGTIHNVIQLLAKTPVALAVLPMGTANALAHDLNLPLDVASAASAALRGRLRRVALGQVRYVNFEGNPGNRYFIIAAGVGVDAHLFYKLNRGVKRRLGMTAYYLKAWHLWLSYPMTRFRVEYEDSSRQRREMSVTEMMSVRIRNFGGVLRELAPGAALERNDLRLILCQTASRFSYLLYVTYRLLGLHFRVTGIELAYSERVSCAYEQAPSGKRPAQEAKIYVEADGELLGTLPAEITVVPDALTILAP